MGVLAVLHPCQRSVWPVVLSLATLRGVQRYPIVGLSLIWRKIITKITLFLPPTNVQAP